MIRVYPWCARCQQVAVLRTGETCVRCVARFEAQFNPDDRTNKLQPKTDPVLRFLRWLGGTK